MVKFFEGVKSICDVKSHKVFMSDDYSGYHNAWKAVFGSPENHLRCTWHILKNWNKHLLQISSQERRAEMKRDLLTVHEELDVNEFQNLIIFFMTKHDYDEDGRKFVDYFRTNCYNRVEQ